MPFWRCYYHLYWATKQRWPFLTNEYRDRMHGVLARLAKHRRMIVHAVGGVEDHVHMVLSVPPAQSISEAVSYIKARSCSIARHEMGYDDFEWQSGYGVLTFGKDALPTVVQYVKHQAEHHAQDVLYAGLERGDDA